MPKNVRIPPQVGDTKKGELLMEKEFDRKDQDQNGNQNQNKVPKKKRKGIIIIALIVTLLIGVVLAIASCDRWFGGEPGGEKTTKSSRELEIDPDAGEYVEPETTQSSAGGISIPGWGSITIPAGQKDVVVDFPNPEANKDKYYLSFELRLKETGEVLYTSGLVEPGLHIQRITLTRALEEGTYAAIVHVQPYKMDGTKTATNNADMETELIVVKA